MDMRALQSIVEKCYYILKKRSVRLIFAKQTMWQVVTVFNAVHDNFHYLCLLQCNPHMRLVDFLIGISLFFALLHIALSIGTYG